MGRVVVKEVSEGVEVRGKRCSVCVGVSVGEILLRKY